jgi:protein involved in polysaccharide export with SLBB domain
MKIILFVIGVVITLAAFGAENPSTADLAPKPERSVKVLGAVNKPGWIPMPLLSAGQRFTIVDAITCAGGPTRYAELRAVRLTRKVTIEIDVRAMMRNPNRADHLVAEDGDTIFVSFRQ